MLTALLFSVCGGAIGWYYSSKLRRRRKYLQDALDFVNYLYTDIGFKQSGLESMAKAFVSRCGRDFSLSLTEFIRYISGKDETLDLSRGLLSENQYNNIYNMFSTLGIYDLATQLKVLEGSRRNIEEIFDKVKSTESKFSGNLIKLGTLFGLMIGILFL